MKFRREESDGLRSGKPARGCGRRYDVASRLVARIDPLENCSSIGCDAANRRVSATDALVNVSSTVFDAAMVLTEETGTILYALRSLRPGRPTVLEGEVSMRFAATAVLIFALVPRVLACDDQARGSRLPAGCEVVMSPGMRITATTSVGTITVTAVDEVTRAYHWDGATRAVEMAPRARRWFGSLGLVYPGAGEHWRDHHGITRCVTEEGQQHFKTVGEALEWIGGRNWMGSVYRDDGLMVGWQKNLARKQLSVQVWQILIDGKKPQRLPGSHDEKIVLESVQTETVPLVMAVASSDLKAVNALLAHGADANATNSVGIPVLVMAIRLGSTPIVEALLKNKADANSRDADTDLTPLLRARTKRDIEPEIARLLLAAGADVNAASRRNGNLTSGFTPLMYASARGRDEVVQLLLERRANVNAKARSGFTALSMAKMAPRRLVDTSGVIRRLEAAGAKR
jgi:hypothetical protein